MTEAVDYVNFLIKENRLEFTGELTVDGVEIKEDKEPIEFENQPNEFGFYGTPDQYGCRPNSFIDEVVAKWSRSSDPFERNAAALAPKRFLFFDSVEHLESDETLKKMLYVNHNKAFMVYRDHNRIAPLVDVSGVEIKNRHFINFGNYNLPGWDDEQKRIEQVSMVPMFIEFWLRDKKRYLMFGGLENRS